MFTPSKNLSNKTSCYHCGEECASKTIVLEDKYFCCHGCKSVFEILNENDLCTFYSLNQNPGTSKRETFRADKFAYLDNAEIQQKLLQFADSKQAQITFYLPQIHCSSCLWLLENIASLDDGIISSRVNFTLKELFISFNKSKTSLRKIVELLTSLGYEPHLSLQETVSNSTVTLNRTYWYKIGVAGFCFGNIMMISFASYFSFSNKIEPMILHFFNLLSLILALPVLLFAASEFFVSAWNGVKNKILNIDFPVSLALLITFSRSAYEIVSAIGTGYLDSFSGIVFFMLIGRWLQARTFQRLAYNRDYKSYFPIAVNVLKNGITTPTEISKIAKQDIVQIHAHEIIPMDGILSKGNALIDYSFVSGENEPVTAKIGEIIYTGGKQIGGNIELMVVKNVSQSYLTNLWNNPIFNKEEKLEVTIYDKIGKYFTYFVLLIGLLAASFWYLNNQANLCWNTLTTVLIVACPCALLLSQNFTNGHIIRILAAHKFYLKSPHLISKLNKINQLVFDKTGTLTQANTARIQYVGKILTNDQKVLIASFAKQSSHPISQLIYDFLKTEEEVEIKHFKEIAGEGIEGWVNEMHVKIGSAKFIGSEFNPQMKSSKAVLYIDGTVLGDFLIATEFRMGIQNLIFSLKEKFKISILSGDNDAEKETLKNLLGEKNELIFNQNPIQKLAYIQKLQNENQANVMMIGDGLNDAGALKQSDFGIAVSDAKNTFTPSSDAIIDANQLQYLQQFIQFAKSSQTIILITFSLSAIYNFIGLFYAVQGVLSPMIAAILMPCSSISIIFLTYFLTEFSAYKNHLKI